MNIQTQQNAITFEEHKQLMADCLTYRFVPSERIVKTDKSKFGDWYRTMAAVHAKRKEAVMERVSLAPFANVTKDLLSKISAKSK